MIEQLAKQLGEKFGLGDKAGDMVGMLMQHIQGKGGLGNLLQGFQAQGLSQQADSWVSTGENIPISGDQAQEALGSDFISDIASKFGIQPQQAADAASQVLPQVVDKLTPEGKVPEGNDLMDQFKGMLGGADLGNIGGMLGGMFGNK